MTDAKGGRRYNGIICEGADHILGYRSPTSSTARRTPGRTASPSAAAEELPPSDDIAFRFCNRAWEQWPLTAEKFAQWVNQINGNGYVCNLFMDYETFGEHQWADTGIFDFMRHLPGEVMRRRPGQQFPHAQPGDRPATSRSARSTCRT